MNTSVHTSDAMARRIAKRRAAERRFQAYGLVAITLAIAALAALFVSIIGNGYTAFQQTFIELEVEFDPEVLGVGADGDAKALSGANYLGLVKKTMRDMFPDVKGRKARRALYGIVSTGAAFMLRERVLAERIGRPEEVLERVGREAHRSDWRSVICRHETWAWSAGGRMSDYAFGQSDLSRDSGRTRTGQPSGRGRAGAGATSYSRRRR